MGWPRSRVWLAVLEVGGGALEASLMRLLRKHEQALASEEREGGCRGDPLQIYQWEC